MMKKVVAPSRTKPRASSLVLALLLANFYFCPPAKADPPPTAQQHFAVTVFDVAGNATATQHFAVNVSDADEITLTLDETSLSLSGSPNTLLADYLTANVITDNLLGYSLTIEAVEPRLKCATGNYYIEPLTSVGAMTDNHWGWAYDSGVSPTTAPSDLTWAGVAISQSEIKNSATATDLDGDDVRIWFGTRVNFSLPACAYGGGSKISAVKNV
jgi:hypothetical protein